MTLNGPQTTTTSPIPLHVSGNKCYVYDIDGGSICEFLEIQTDHAFALPADVKRLRVAHHICGVLVGTLPQVAQQNIFLGLPLQLLPEEVAILVDNRLAVLVDAASSHASPTLSQAEHYAAARLQSARAQQAFSAQQDEDKTARMSDVYKEEIDKRRKEKVDKRNEVTERTEVELLQEEQQKSDLSAEKHKKDTTKIPWSVVISGSSTGLPWYTPANSTYTTLSSARLANVNTYPEDSLNELAVARIKVFGDLWKKGYFMGSGLKFGGDFLVYPGDPLRFHSHFTLTVFPTPLAEIRPIDIVSWGRLATAVKKAHLLGSWNARKEEVQYLSLEWAGFG
ncbi:MAG: tRNA-splicing endonuclease subunit [Cyphobasidiales sp. Tagirdzhanova-0007]|nr:MAG: tRNA-splicing endonuclease subunit [Cyphobasidiales sp. Tagirdzhanova-0007]